MITDDTAWLLVEACRLLNLSSRGLRVCELGNQHAGWRLRGPVKTVLEWLGMVHLSIDLNGADGARALDLSKPLPPELLGKFDLVTNAGTTEHVGAPGDLRAQWQVFKSIHDLAAPHAAMIHIIPDVEGSHGGCAWVYTDGFIPALANLCGYPLHQYYPSKSDRHHLAALLLKPPYRAANPLAADQFPSFEQFCAIDIGVRGAIF